MERIIFSKSASLATTPATIAAIGVNGIAEGAVALYDNTGAIIKSTLTKRIPSFSLFVGGGAFANKSQYNNNVLDIDTYRLEVAKTVFAAGTKLNAKITVPTPVKDKDYTITMVKPGTVLNERYKWSSSTRSKEGDTATTVAKRLADELVALGKNEGFKATASGAVVTITASDYQNWSIIAGDNLYGATVTYTTKGMKPVNDDAAIRALQERCIGGEGINYTDKNAYELYKLPEYTSASGWVTYALTFYNGRNLRSGNTENVKSIVYLAVPVGSASITNLDAIFASLTSTNIEGGGVTPDPAA